MVSNCKLISYGMLFWCVLSPVTITYHAFFSEYAASIPLWVFIVGLPLSISLFVCSIAIWKSKGWGLKMLGPSLISFVLVLKYSEELDGGLLAFSLIGNAIIAAVVWAIIWKTLGSNVASDRCEETASNE